MLFQGSVLACSVSPESPVSGLVLDVELEGMKMARPEPLGSKCTHCGWGQRAPPRAANSVTHLPECCHSSSLVFLEIPIYVQVCIHTCTEAGGQPWTSFLRHCSLPFFKDKISHWEILRSPRRRDWLANESPGSASLCLASVTKWYYKGWDYKNAPPHLALHTGFRSRTLILRFV